MSINLLSLCEDNETVTSNTKHILELSDKIAKADSGKCSFTEKRTLPLTDLC
jgi:hypothetical protein